ncbi:MAG: pyruvate kinase, partial [Terricaulis sp.]
VATLGPASSDPAVLERMFSAGVDVVRLNFSHGSAADFEIMARAAARTLDAERDYEAALDGERNWLAHAFVNGGKDASDITADWRAQNAPPSDLEDAAWLEAMRALVVAEEHRTAALEEYWTWTRLSGRVCCGTMPGCALAAPSVASSGGATHD